MAQYAVAVSRCRLLHAVPLPEGGRAAAACSVAFGVVGKQPVIAVGYADGIARLSRWSGECVAALQGAHAGRVLGIDLSRDGKFVATAGVPHKEVMIDHGALYASKGAARLAS